MVSADIRENLLYCNYLNIMVIAYFIKFMPFDADPDYSQSKQTGVVFDSGA